jgi:hypothetical protein
MAAFMPGESPPLVKTPILFILLFINPADAQMAAKPRKVREMNANFHPPFHITRLDAGMNL